MDAMIYYVPVLGKKNKKTLNERYEEWDMEKYFRWTRLKEYAPAYQYLDCIVASWAKHNNVFDDNVIILVR